jgi:hypothetical protein
MGGGIIMSYTVGKVKTYSNVPLPEGKHYCIIEVAKIKDVDSRFVEANLKEMNIQPKQISILLKNDKGEQIWDTIWQNFDKDSFTLKWATNKMNIYSNALEIPLDTHFKEIEDWLKFIEGKEVVVTVGLREDGRTRIEKIESITEGGYF